MSETKDQHEHVCKFAKMFRAYIEPEATHAYHECVCGATRKNDEDWIPAVVSSHNPENLSGGSHE